MMSFQEIRRKWQLEDCALLDALVERLHSELDTGVRALNDSLAGTKYCLLQDLSFQLENGVRLLTTGKFIDKDGNELRKPPAFPAPRILARKRLIDLTNDIERLRELKIEVESDFEKRMGRLSESTRDQDEVRAGLALRELESLVSEHVEVDFGPRLERARKAFDPEGWKRSGVLGRAILAAGAAREEELGALALEHPECKDTLDALRALADRCHLAESNLQKAEQNLNLETKAKLEIERRLELALVEAAGATEKLRTLATMKTRLERAQLELYELRRAKAAAEARLEVSVAERTKAKEDAEARAAESTRLKDRLAKAERDRDEEAKRKSDAEQKLQATQAELSEAASRLQAMATIEAQISKVHIELAELQQGKAAVEADLKEVTESKNKAVRDAEGGAAELARLKGRLARAEEERDQEVKVKYELEWKLQAARAELGEAEKRLRSLATIETKLSKAEVELDELRQGKTAAEARLEAVTAERNKNAHEAETQAAELAGLRERLEKAERERDEEIKIRSEVEHELESALAELGEARAGQQAPQVRIPPVPLPDDDLANSLGMRMIRVRPGEFQMGSPESELDRYADETPHLVRLTKAYWLGVTAVTQGQWELVVGSNPSYFKLSGPDAPVERVSWEEAMEFCQKLTELERAAGKLPPEYAYSLPTEAQWECACRAGTATRFSFGDDLDYAQAGKYAWHAINSGERTHKVGEKIANPWGFYDMHGNVWEWCLDWHGTALPGEICADPFGPSAGSLRVLRGGSWHFNARDCRSASRYGIDSGYRSSDLGFRIVLVAIS